MTKMIDNEMHSTLYCERMASQPTTMRSSSDSFMIIIKCTVFFNVFQFFWFVCVYVWIFFIINFNYTAHFTFVSSFFFSFYIQLFHSVISLVCSARIYHQQLSAGTFAECVHLNYCENFCREHFRARARCCSYSFWSGSNARMYIICLMACVSVCVFRLNNSNNNFIQDS